MSKAAKKNGNGGEATARDMKAVMTQLEKCLALAVDNENENEARNAAMKAVHLMTDHDIVPVPKADIDRAKKFVEGAQALAKQVQGEKQKNMMIGGLIGFALAGGGKGAGLRLF